MGRNKENGNVKGLLHYSIEVILNECEESHKIEKSYEILRLKPQYDDTNNNHKVILMEHLRPKNLITYYPGVVDCYVTLYRTFLTQW